MKIQCEKKLLGGIDLLGILAIWGLILERFWGPKWEQNMNCLVDFVIWASFGRLCVTWGSFWGRLRNFWRHFVRLGVRNGVSKRLFGELLCDARAKKHEGTCFKTRNHDVSSIGDHAWQHFCFWRQFFEIWSDLG